MLQNWGNFGFRGGFISTHCAWSCPHADWKTQCDWKSIDPDPIQIPRSPVQFCASDDDDSWTARRIEYKISWCSTYNIIRLATTKAPWDGRKRFPIKKKTRIIKQMIKSEGGHVTRGRASFALGPLYYMILSTTHCTEEKLRNRGKSKKVRHEQTEETT